MYVAVFCSFLCKKYQDNIESSEEIYLFISHKSSFDNCPTLHWLKIDLEWVSNGSRLRWLTSWLTFQIWLSFTLVNYLRNPFSVAYHKTFRCNVRTSFGISFFITMNGLKMNAMFGTWFLFISRNLGMYVCRQFPRDCPHCNGPKGKEAHFRRVALCPLRKGSRPRRTRRYTTKIRRLQLVD